jgi:hypothetical protein
MSENKTFAARMTRSIFKREDFSYPSTFYAVSNDAGLPPIIKEVGFTTEPPARPRSKSHMRRMAREVALKILSERGGSA